MEWIIIWMLCGAVAAVIGASKGEGCLAFIVGFIFGPFGIVFTLLSSGNRKACPSCKELMKKDAVICPRCRMPASVVATVAAQGQQYPSPPLRGSEVPPPPPPGHVRRFRIARNGEDLGELAVPAIRQMIASRELTMQDYYLDPDANEWMQLDCLADIV